MNKHNIIGLGGVGLKILRELSSNPPDFIERAVLWDGDIVEEANLERQLFLPEHVGMTKSQAAKELFDNLGDTVLTQRDFTMDELPSFKENDVLIMATDNVESRILALNAADHIGLKVYSAANGTTDEGLGIGSTAWYYQPDWANTEKDPRIRLKLTDQAHAASVRIGRPCSEVSEPQTALANSAAAIRCVELLWLWHSDVNPDHLPIQHSMEYRQEVYR